MFKPIFIYYGETFVNLLTVHFIDLWENDGPEKWEGKIYFHGAPEHVIVDGETDTSFPKIDTWTFENRDQFLKYLGALKDLSIKF